jgi:uncharacterized protein with GYD domain
VAWGGALAIRTSGGEAMPIYITLANLTEKGIQEIKDAPQRIEENIKAGEAMGGKSLGIYMTMGEYDYVWIAEAPNDEVAMTFLLGLGLQGLVRTKTLKAFTKEEMAKFIKNLP